MNTLLYTRDEYHDEFYDKICAVLSIAVTKKFRDFFSLSKYLEHSDVNIVIIDYDFESYEDELYVINYITKRFDAYPILISKFYNILIEKVADKNMVIEYPKKTSDIVTALSFRLSIISPQKEVVNIGGISLK